MAKYIYIYSYWCLKKINAVSDVALDIFSRPHVEHDFLTVTRSWVRFPLSTKREVKNLSIKVTCGNTGDRLVRDDVSEVGNAEDSEAGSPAENSGVRSPSWSSEAESPAGNSDVESSEESEMEKILE